MKITYDNDTTFHLEIKNFDFYDILKDDKKAIRFLDDLGFIKEFDCQNKPDCNAYEAIIIEYK